MLKFKMLYYLSDCLVVLTSGCRAVLCADSVQNRWQSVKTLCWLPFLKCRVIFWKHKLKHSQKLEITWRPGQPTTLFQFWGFSRMLLFNLWPMNLHPLTSHLSFHAAGPYKMGTNDFSDLYISPYTSSLTSLISARSSVNKPQADLHFF
jgi:hypothetical protein